MRTPYSRSDMAYRDASDARQMVADLKKQIADMEKIIERLEELVLTHDFLLGNPE